MRHTPPVVFSGHELKCAFGIEMPYDRVIVLLLEHLCTASASSQAVQLRLVVEEIVMLLPVALVMA